MLMRRSYGRAARATSPFPAISPRWPEPASARNVPDTFLASVERVADRSRGVGSDVGRPLGDARARREQRAGGADVALDALTRRIERSRAPGRPAERVGRMLGRTGDQVRLGAAGEQQLDRARPAPSRRVQGGARVDPAAVQRQAGASSRSTTVSSPALANLGSSSASPWRRTAPGGRRASRPRATAPSHAVGAGATATPRGPRRPRRRCARAGGAWCGRWRRGGARCADSTPAAPRSRRRRGPGRRAGGSRPRAG